VLAVGGEIVFTVDESPESPDLVAVLWRVRRPEGGYEARAVSQPIFTEADALEELRSTGDFR
jgi:hypothetical protein